MAAGDFPSDLGCIVIGAGPAGVTAAAHLADAGVSVLLVDEGVTVGGRAAPVPDEDERAAPHWPDRYYRAGALRNAVAARQARITHRQRCRVEQIDGQRVAICNLDTGIADTAMAPCLLLATGAEEIPAAIAWNKARGVYPLGDPDALIAAARAQPGARLVLAGMGPLLWAAAAHVAAARVPISAVIDAAGRPTLWQGIGLLRRPGLLAQGLGWRRAVWSSRAPILRESAVVAAEGDDRLTATAVAGLYADRTRTRVATDLLAIGYGLRPRRALAPQGTRPGLVIAGDAERVAGLDAAVATGTLAAADVLRTLDRPIGPALGAASVEAEAELKALRSFLWAVERWSAPPLALSELLGQRD